MIGDVLATAVSLLNPGVLALGGDLVLVQDHFLGAVRERLYQRTQPQAARGLRLVASRLGDRAAVVGAARLALEQVLSPETVDRSLAARQQPVERPVGWPGTRRPVLRPACRDRGWSRSAQAP